MMENMKEKWQEFQVTLEEITTLSKREYLLTLSVCLLSGLVIGMLVSPKKRIMIGSHNGNNNGNGNTGGLPQDEEAEEAEA
mgnify:CR=1 FL=1